MPGKELLEVAERAARFAVRHGAESAEAFVERSRSGGARIEKNRVGGVESESTFGIGLRVLKAGRLGFAHLSREEDLSAAVEGALATARLAKRLPRFGFAARGRLPRVDGIYDARIAGLEGPDVLELSLDLVAGAKSVSTRLDVTEAGVSFGSIETAIANTEGLAVQGRESSIAASCFVVQREKGVSTGFASGESTRWTLDASALGREAAALAMAARDPKKLGKPGRRTLVLRPEPAADLLGTLTLASLHGKSASRGESYYSGRQGKRVAHPKFTLIDDPTRRGGLGSSPFDDEGEPSRPVPLIRNGILKTFLFDRASGAEFRHPSTGSAMRIHPFDGRNYKSPPAISARNVRLEAPSVKTQRLVAGVDDGLLIHDMMGVHTANTVSGDFSVTSTVLFRIRKGAIEGPVSPVSVAGNLHAALREGLLLGDDVKQTSGEAAIEMPSVRVDSFTVTP